MLLKNKGELRTAHLHLHHLDSRFPRQVAPTLQTGAMPPQGCRGRDGRGNAQVLTGCMLMSQPVLSPGSLSLSNPNRISILSVHWLRSRRLSAETEEGGPSSLGGRRKASLQGHDALHSYSPQSTQCKRSGCDTVDTSRKNLAFGKTAHSNNTTPGENTTGAGPSKAAQLHKQNTNNDHGWMPLPHGVLKVHKPQHRSPDGLSQRKEKPRSYNNICVNVHSFVHL